MPSTRILATLVVIGLATLALVAQTGPGPAQPPPRFRTGIDVIQLDVTVLDPQRRPVRGLTAADFTVLEDGKPQPVVGFAEIVVPEPETPPAAWIREVAPDVRTNNIPADGRLIVIVMDDATMPPDAKMIAGAKEVGRKVVEAMGPADLVAVVFTLNNRNSQDFTSDRARLLRVINRFAPGFAWNQTMALSDPAVSRRPPTAFADDSLYRQYSIDTLANAAKYLRDIPRRKKTLIYVSVGVPVDVEQAVMPVALGTEGVRAHDTLIQQDLIHAMQDTFGQALSANVNIYGVDPGGLGGMESFLESRGVDMVAARRTARLHTDFLRAVSENSGGRAIVDTNDPERAVGDVFRENSSYYLVGYQTPTLAQDGKFRRLEVRVNRPGVTVQSRKGYFVPKPPKPRKANDPEPSPLATAMAGFLPKGDVPMQVVAAPFAIEGKKEVAVAIVARLHHPRVEARTRQQVELITTAFDNQGKARASRRQTARLVIVPTDAPEAQYEAITRIDLKPGTYNIRIASHTPSLGTSGSVYCDVDVPDFSREGVWLSGAALVSTPAFAAAPRDALVGLLPFLPTTRRAFEAGDEAFAFVRIYQQGRKAVGAVSISARVVDGSGRMVDQVDDTVSAERFSKAGAADYRFNLPLSILAPGPHLLTIEAKAAGTSIRRDVRFVKTGRSGG